MKTTIGQLLLNDALPEDLRQPQHVLDKKGISALMARVVERHPEQYRDILHKLMDLGREATYISGGNSFGPEHLRPGAATLIARNRIRAAQQQIFSDDTLSDEAKQQKLMDVVATEKEQLVGDLYKESLQEGNPFAQQIISGARGGPVNLASLRGFDGAYEGNRGEVIPIPILRNYSEGLSPAEYFASTFGGRKGVVDVKQGVAKFGYVAKQLAQLTHRLLVSQFDDEDDPDNSKRLGMPSPIDDSDNEGSLLAVDHGPYKRNTVVTPKIAHDLKKAGFEELLLRSPIVGGPADGGVYARDAGMRERGGLPPLGDYIGLAGSQSVSEKLTQSGLCLAAGTLVRMADDTVKTIELIQVGDRVLGSDITGRTFPVCVTAVFDNGVRPCWLYKAGEAHRIDPDDAFVSCTEDHKFLNPLAGSGQLAVSPVSRCDWVVRVNFNDSDNAELPVNPVKDLGELPTFDIEVNHPDHLFVLANGLIVSNSSKHSGGVAGAGPAGPELINALLQVPENFVGGATHAQKDGHVTDITDAPQGGQMLFIDGEQHYVPPDRKLLVQAGSVVEAGDILTDGLPNPAEIVAHKGVGEGRRYFVDAFRKALKESGIRSHRRNLELISRGLIDHVEVTDPWEDYAPGDVIPYRVAAANWRPRDGSAVLAPAKAVGQYLERPTLHYTIGTQIKPSMLPKLQKFGVTGLEVHSEPPPFQPQMQRAATSISTDPDWQTRMLGSGQQSNLLDAVHRGGSSDTAGTSYVPALIQGTDFGKVGPTKGWGI